MKSKHVEVFWCGNFRNRRPVRPTRNASLAARGHRAVDRAARTFPRIAGHVCTRALDISSHKSLPLRAVRCPPAQPARACFTRDVGISSMMSPFAATPAPAERPFFRPSSKLNEVHKPYSCLEHFIVV